jgi:hypothetical protein
MIAHILLLLILKSTKKEILIDEKMDDELLCLMKKTPSILFLYITIENIVFMSKHHLGKQNKIGV